MKKIVLIIGSVLFLTLTVFSGCQSRTTKVKNAEVKVQNDKKDLADSKAELYNIRLDTISNYEQFRIESEKIIVSQEKNIAEFKAKMATEKKEINADYNKKLLAMEKKNNELKRNLNDYKEEGKDKWIGFKQEFNHDMNELGKAFKDLTVENVK
jgi:hypothetical protein